MAIQKRKNRAGKTLRYVVVVSVPNPTGGRGTRHVVGTFDLKADAEAAEREAKRDIQRGTFVPKSQAAPKAVTVADLVDLWFETKKLTITPNTATGYESAIRLHLIPALGERAVADLTHDDVQRQVSAWQDAGMGARLIHRNVVILRAALARAVKARTLTFNVADGIVKPKVQRKRKVTVWTPSQVTKFLAAAEEDSLFPLWHLMLLEGLRRGEALGLRWSDVAWSEDETMAEAHINQTVVPDAATGRTIVQPRVKNENSERIVALTETTIKALKRHQDRQEFLRKQAGEMWTEHGLIVTTALGTPVNPNNVKRNRQRLMKRAEVPSLTSHDLRHVCASIMVKNNAPMATVSRKLGHANFATTSDLYAHLEPSDQAMANATTEAYIARGRAETGS